eukprot:615289-Alexandrium_andersonii.AAC.1
MIRSARRHQVLGPNIANAACDGDHEPFGSNVDLCHCWGVGVLESCKWHTLGSQRAGRPCWCSVSCVGWFGQNESREAGSASMRGWLTVHGKMYHIGQARVPGPAEGESQGHSAHEAGMLVLQTLNVTSLT